MVNLPPIFAASCRASTHSHTHVYLVCRYCKRGNAILPLSYQRQTKWPRTLAVHRNRLGRLARVPCTYIPDRADKGWTLDALFRNLGGIHERSNRMYEHQQVLHSPIFAQVCSQQYQALTKERHSKAQTASTTAHCGLCTSMCIMHLGVPAG